MSRIWWSTSLLLLTLFQLKWPFAVALNNTFPSLAITRDMATLSLIVYSYRTVQDEDSVCSDMNEKYEQFQCHWYHHDRVQGTQVLIVVANAPTPPGAVEETLSKYIAIVFAGTDDVRTSLTDANILTTPFGDNVTYLPEDASLSVRVHAGFDHAVFAHDLFLQIVTRVEVLLQSGNGASRIDQIYTTGHSLGAANSILTAVGLTLQQQIYAQITSIQSISFGCPRIGNYNWRELLHNENTTGTLRLPTDKLAIWRLVLGWDLVPRLPELFYHVGHTIQLFHNNNKTDGNSTTPIVYYQHYGNADLGYAGVPIGWSSKPFIWVPGALESHSIVRYHETLYEQFGDHGDKKKWILEFERVNNNVIDTDDRYPPHVDDDFWLDPPDDDLRARIE